MLKHFLLFFTFTTASFSMAPQIDINKDSGFVEMGYYAVLSKDRYTCLTVEDWDGDRYVYQTFSNDNDLESLSTSSLCSCTALILYGETKDEQPIIALCHWDTTEEFKSIMRTMYQDMVVEHGALPDLISYAYITSRYAINISREYADDRIAELQSTGIEIDFEIINEKVLDGTAATGLYQPLNGDVDYWTE